ncbi:MAG TPA: universal stress protein [Thermoleophilaceae bacterium]
MCPTAGEGLNAHGLASEQFTPRGPVLLATLSCRPNAEAEDAAIGAALDSGAPLVIVNAVARPMLPLTLYLAGISAAVPPEDEDLAAVRASAERAAALGLSVQHLRLVARNPISALSAVARERRAGLLVFGPDPRRIGRRKFRSAARKIRKTAECLVLVLPWDEELSAV